GLSEGRNAQVPDRLRRGSFALSRRPTPLAAPRGRLRLHGAGARGARGVLAVPDRLFGVAEPSRLGRVYTAVGAVRGSRKLSGAGRRRGVLAGHHELRRL